jgi:hypothetical protein
MDRLRSEATPNRSDMVIGATLAVALISVFLPWYGFSCGPAAPCAPGSTLYSGFGGFGFVYLSLVLVSAGFWIARMVFPMPARPDFHLNDWQAFMMAALLLVLSALAFWITETHSSGVGYTWGAEWGWYIALAAAIGLAVGGWMRKEERAEAPAPPRPHASSAFAEAGRLSGESEPADPA